jgi:hypothetical protein
MRRGGAPAAAAPPRAAAAQQQYRVTVATSETSTHASAAAFLCVRGAGGAPLGPWPLARAPGCGLPPPLARASADAFVLSAPLAAAAAAGPLTHVSLWTEAPRAGGGAGAAGSAPPTAAARASWRAALGGGHSHSSGGGGGSGEWNVRWVTIEELPPAGGDDDDDDDDDESEDSEEESDDEDGSAAHARRARPPRQGRRTFFFAVDQARACSRVFACCVVSVSRSFRSRTRLPCMLACVRLCRRCRTPPPAPRAR